MGCIDRLPISQEELKETDLERTLDIYKDAHPGPGYNPCQILAKNILNKWYRSRHDIKTTYDADGNFDQGWR